MSGEQQLNGSQAAASALAKNLADAGDLDSCLRILLQLLREKPRHAALHVSAGQIYKAMWRLPESAEMFRVAVSLDPCSERAHGELASTLLLLGRHDEALACYEALRMLAPLAPEPSAGIAQVHLVRGEVQIATRLIEPWLERDPVPPSFAALFASVAKHAGRETEAIGILERALARIPGRQFQIRGHYQLGSLLEQTGAYDDAFAAYREANTRWTRPWHPDEHAERTAGTIASWTAEAIAARCDRALPAELPVLIVGMPRSGTSLVEQILSSHSQVHGAGELFELPRLLTRRLGAAKLDGLGLLPPIGEIDSQDVTAAGEQYLAALGRHGGDAVRVIDKLPANAHVLGLLQLMLPRSRVIHVRRDPLDCCVSCYCTHFRGGLHFATDLAHIGRYHADVERVMAHWRAVLELAMLEVRYEELVADPEGQSRRMIRFLGLEWEDACLAFHESRRDVRTASRQQVREPIHGRSIGRHRRFDAHLAPLRDALD